MCRCELPASWRTYETRPIDQALCASTHTVPSPCSQTPACKWVSLPSSERRATRDVASHRHQDRPHPLSTIPSHWADTLTRNCGGMLRPFSFTPEPELIGLSRSQLQIQPMPPPIPARPAPSRYRCPHRSESRVVPIACPGDVRCHRAHRHLCLSKSRPATVSSRARNPTPQQFLAIFQILLLRLGPWKLER